MARQRDVIAIDLPGFGDSPVIADDEPASAAAMAEQVASFCDALGVERPHVAGNSLGAWVALELAKRDRARSLYLISPAGLRRRPLGSRSFNTRGLAKLLKPVLFGLVLAPSWTRFLRTGWWRPIMLLLPFLRVLSFLRLARLRRALPYPPRG